MYYLRSEMIYTDGQHTVADSENELHEWVQRVLGFKVGWYHDKYLKGPKKGSPNNHPHYDVMSCVKKKVMKQYVYGSVKGHQHMMKRCSNVKFVRPRDILELSKKMIKDGYDPNWVPYPELIKKTSNNQ
jgi:hypothetical protein